jgi:hypothetical protein
MKAKILTSIEPINRDEQQFLAGLHDMSVPMEEKLKENLLDIAEEPSVKVLCAETPYINPNEKRGVFSLLKVTGSSKTPDLYSYFTIDSKANSPLQQRCYLNVFSTPIYDDKHAMKVNIGGLSLLVEFAPVAQMTTTADFDLNSNCSNDELMNILVPEISSLIHRHSQIFDAIKVFRSIAFESTADAVENSINEETLIDN